MVRPSSAAPEAVTPCPRATAACMECAGKFNLLACVRSEARCGLKRGSAPLRREERVRSWARVERALLVRASATALSCLILDHLEVKLISEGNHHAGNALAFEGKYWPGYGVWGKRLLHTCCGLSLESAHGLDDEHQRPVRSFETSVRSCASLRVKKNGLKISCRPG